MNIRRRVVLLMVALSGMAAAVVYGQAAHEKTFHGEIADTQCALNVHSLSQSHKEMIQMRSDLKTNADCARFCVKERGGKFVLQAGEKVYRLDKPEEAEPFAGEQVKIVGTLDTKTNTITVRRITPVTGNGPSGAAAQ